MTITLEVSTECESKRSTDAQRLLGIVLDFASRQSARLDTTFSSHSSISKKMKQARNIRIYIALKDKDVGAHVILSVLNLPNQHEYQLSY